MKTVAIFYQGRKQVTSEFAAKLTSLLQRRGYEVRSINLLNEGEDCADSSFQGCSLVLVLGGDGTIVHAARVCACLNLPMVGINFGRVGFLTEIEPDEIEVSLAYYLDSDPSVWVDKRTMLQAKLEQDGHTEQFLALNDIVIARGTWPRMVHVKVWIDDYFYNTTYSDGMIVSTATGSTAYNMAAGGPLLHPQVRSIIITPISPHLESNRSLIIPPEACVKLQIFTGSQDGVFSADGQINRDVKNGAIVEVKKSPYVTRFLRRKPPTNFYHVITNKLSSTQSSESHYVT